MAVAKALEMADRGYQVVMLVDKTKHLMWLVGMFKEWYNINVAWLHGQMPDRDYKATMAKVASGEARICVATTVFDYGVNFPDLVCLIFCGAV